MMDASVCADTAEWADMNGLCRWVAHSYLSSEIHTGRWMGACVRA